MRKRIGGIQCTSCGRDIMINKATYAPPNTNHPIMDEGLWCEAAHGYICMNCFGRGSWSPEEIEQLEQDWGWY